MVEVMSSSLKEILYSTILDATRRIPTAELIRAVARKSGSGEGRVRRAIADLVRAGEVRYTYLYGSSFLETSFDRPVRVSSRIVIKPPDRAYEQSPGELVLDITQGAAFGNGDHPTTRLALQALDSALAVGPVTASPGASKGLDVGTGSGVLAIALARLGITHVVGLDIDPCALSEATQNVFLNGLDDQVTVTCKPLEELAMTFSVIVANLAGPTLIGMAQSLSGSLEEGGLLVLSGFKSPASEGVVQAYTRYGIRLVREEAERDWVCLTFRKGH